MEAGVSDHVWTLAEIRGLVGLGPVERQCSAILSCMSRPMLGVICGLVYGALSAASMIPLSFPDKRAALLGAFINRFSIGCVIGAIALPWPGWLSGLVVGVLLSLADAIITKSYAPILILGAIGGTIIGWIIQRFGH
jgi:hypothetical protein